MTGGLIQLASYGIEDLCLTDNPQITFFKIIYRRHTNFACEEFVQYFTSPPNFGGRYVCIIPHEADLIDRIALRITLPAIPKFQLADGDDNLTKFAWVRHIGHAIIKCVEVEINGVTIDRHYGEWLHIWSTLTTHNLYDGGFDKMIGNVPELYEFTNGKPAYTLYIPLYFWFCRNTCLSLPLVALQYTDLRVNIELNDFNKCSIICPSHYIKCRDNLVSMLPYEYLYQVCSDKLERFGMFVNYDIVNKRLYYLKIGDNKFIEETPTYTKPAVGIFGMSSNYMATPEVGAVSIMHIYKRLTNIYLKDASLLVDYVYLDDEERYKLAKTTQDYIIEQLYFTPNQIIDGSNRKLKLIIDQPCKLMVWVVQYDYIKNSNDTFNYTTSHVRKRSYDVAHIDPARKKIFDNVNVGDTIGTSIIEKELLLLNSKQRLNQNQHIYHGMLQPYQHSDNFLPTGCGMYSFALLPVDTQPSGTTNMSQIELIELMLKLNYQVNPAKKVSFRSYSLCYNVWRITCGLSSTVFVTKL